MPEPRRHGQLNRSTPLITMYPLQGPDVDEQVLAEHPATVTERHQAITPMTRVAALQ